MRIKAIIVAGGIALAGFTGLRLYGAYRSEKTGAIIRAEQALFEASEKEKEANSVQENFEMLSRSTRIVETPSGPVFSPSPKEMIALVDKQMALGRAAIDLKFYAEMEARYSTNRKLQTVAIAHKAWLVLIGATQRNEEWINFLTEHETRPDTNCAEHIGCKDGDGRPARRINP